MKQLRILPEVWEDADEAAAWHDKKDERELGDRFLATFRAQLPAIVRFARTHRKVYTEFSRVFAKPSPYAIYFRIHQDWMVVTLLWHTARNREVLRTTLTERDPDDQ